jgi:hypothetical protein
MYLLEVDSFVQFLYWFLGSAAGLLIFYFIIKAAVKAGTDDIKRQIRLLYNLKIIDMTKKGGHSEEEISALADEILNK